jgi:hypothetical protein
MTDQDLKEMGVLLGHRRKMLAAIGDLTGKSGDSAAAPVTGAPIAPVPKPAGAAPSPISAPKPAPEVTGERRYLAVMFCDLVGSTAMSARLDAEEWRDLVSAYLDAASLAITDMGGHVAKKLGDGILALFGYPLAHENHAERAARAAQRGLGDARTPLPASRNWPRA